MSKQPADEIESRQERREERLKKKREKIPQHGRGLGRIYKEAILKRIRHLRSEKEKGKGGTRGVKQTK